MYKARRGRKNIFYISRCMCFVCELAILLLLLLPTKHIGIELRKRIGKSERKGVTERREGKCKEVEKEHWQIFFFFFALQCKIYIQPSEALERCLSVLIMWVEGSMRCHDAALLTTAPPLLLLLPRKLAMCLQISVKGCS